jgi:Tfp pilus assembly protein PilN
MSATPESPRHVLGVALLPQTVEAVLLRSSDAGEQVLHRMVRPRYRAGETVRPDDFSSVLPGMKSSDEIDFTLEVGEGDLDDGLDTAAFADLDDAGAPSARPFAVQLRELLEECDRRGYPAPDLAFCVDAPDVTYVPITLPPDAEGASFAPESLWGRVRGYADGLSAEQQALLAALNKQYAGPVDPRRVAFVPMTDAGVDRRFLAILPTAEESVTPTVQALAMSDEAVDRSGRLLESQASVLAHAVAEYLPNTPEENAAVVRVGLDDTLLLFFRGGVLRHVDRLRSLTSFDPAETICSRVLLHQDEAKIGDLAHVVLVGGPRDGRLAERFGAFYEQAAIHELNTLLDEEAVGIAADTAHQLVPDSGLAIAAALRMTEAPAINLFGPDGRTRRRRPAMWAWHTVAVAVLLCAAALAFGWRYMDRQQEIAELEQQIAMSPVPVPELTPVALKHRVDSLNAVHARHSRALYVLDSLLVGSDEWSRAMERTAAETAAIEGIWFDNWSITPTVIRLQGHALDRNNLAAFARSLDAVIEELKFTDIQGARAYPFVITIARQIELPEVTKRLRDDALSPALVPSGDSQLVSAPSVSPSR